METLQIGQRIDIYEVLPNTRYEGMTIGRWYPATEINESYNFVGLPSDIWWTPDNTYHVHTQICDIPVECVKKGTLIIKSLKTLNHERM